MRNLSSAAYNAAHTRQRNLKPTGVFRAYSFARGPARQLDLHVLLHVEPMPMNPLVLGAMCGIAFGVADVLITVFGNHPDVTRSMLLQAFSSRFAIGVLGANVSLGMDRVVAGALAGLLISLPDAFAVHSYVGVLGTGVAFGAIAGWAAKKWAN
jgi:hypothetical protein